MKACVLHAPAPIQQRPLRVEDVTLPRPQRGEVLIKVRACGVCRTDLHVVEDELDQPRQKNPVIPGHQVVGEVVSGDLAACGFAPNQRVGVAWLHCTCGECRFCRTDRENLCHGL